MLFDQKSTHVMVTWIFEIVNNEGNQSQVQRFHQQESRGCSSTRRKYTLHQHEWRESHTPPELPCSPKHSNFTIVFFLESTKIMLFIPFCICHCKKPQIHLCYPIPYPPHTLSSLSYPCPTAETIVCPQEFTIRHQQKPWCLWLFLPFTFFFWWKLALLWRYCFLCSSLKLGDCGFSLSSWMTGPESGLSSFISLLLLDNPSSYLKITAFIAVPCCQTLLKIFILMLFIPSPVLSLGYSISI